MSGSRRSEVWRAGNVAVVTGGASGIGLAACRRFVSIGMSVVVADVAGERLERSCAELEAASRGAGAVMAAATDVSRRSGMTALADTVRARFGRVDVLMANAGIQPGSGIVGPAANWDAVIGTNLLGVVHSVQAFLPGMIEAGRPGTVIVTGSKQGITTPPGDPAYNVAKAGVKAFAEALQHELRNREGCGIEAHLLIPGFVYTALTRGDRTEKPKAAWTPEQTVGFMFERIEAGDFYILCPDNDVDRATDEKRMRWAIGDIVENRPPLSRWHPDHKDAFDRFVRGVD